ncbi:MAG TPA: hypothetical protein ENH67_04500 [Pseudoalteromonas sp.]|uniref:hypothetical protein n=1 Tax=Pseudoalteromonas sp. TaxID=53249 RepID=UPI0017CE5F19|nr:hypothetical protein [Pseudoalteromonas sp.]HDZ32129.1 hypothetical protein [Pseudoalteromonas sp.]
MFPQCRSCSKKISLSWFLTAFKWTKYRCVKCGSIHEFTTRRGYIAGIVGASTAFFYPIKESSIFYSPLLFVLVVFAALVLSSLIPGQHELVVTEESVDQ